MPILGSKKTALNNVRHNRLRISLVFLKVVSFGYEPGEDVLVELAHYFGSEKVHVTESLNGILAKADQVLFALNARHVFLVRIFALQFTGPLLDSPPFIFIFHAKFGCLKTLCLNEHRISNFLILFLLFVHCA